MGVANVGEGSTLLVVMIAEVLCDGGTDELVLMLAYKEDVVEGLMLPFPMMPAARSRYSRAGSEVHCSQRVMSEIHFTK